MSRLLKDLRTNENIASCYAFGATHHVAIEEKKLESNGGNFDMDKLSNFLIDKNHTEIEIHPITAGIEDCFMELAG